MAKQKRRRRPGVTVAGRGQAAAVAGPMAQTRGPGKIMGLVGAQSLSTGWTLTILLAAVGAITLPFIFKAFHLDDTFFIWLAQEKLHNAFALGLPNHAYEGNFFPLYLDTHPPLLTSYMSLLIRVGGASEVLLHLGFIVFPALAAVSMYFLGRRFTGSPLVAALLLVATPGFMVMSQSIMTDVPALALWLAAIAAYVHGVDQDDDLRLLALSGVFVALAILTTYQSFCLLPLLFVYALLQPREGPVWRRLTWKNMAPLGAALLVFLGIIVFYYAQTGGPPKLSYSIGVDRSPTFMANKLLTTVSVIGGAGIFPLALAAGLLKRRRDYVAFAGLLSALLVFFLLKVSSGQYTPVSALLQAVFYAAGTLALYRFFNWGVDAAFAQERSREDRDRIFLLLWIVGVIVYTVALLPYSSSRYLLPLLPPVILMFVAYARGVFARPGAWWNFTVAAVACTAAAGLAVSISDYSLAGVYRDFAATQAPQLEAGGHQLWFAGEFGLRYYLEENGGHYLTKDDNSPAPGDHVVLSHGLIAYFISPQLQGRLRLEQTINYPSAWPVRVEDPGSLAGFYDQFHGNLPWSLASGPVETIDVYVVQQSL